MKHLPVGVAGGLYGHCGGVHEGLLGLIVGVGVGLTRKR